MCGLLERCLASGASASTAPTGDIPTQKTAPVILAEEEISDVSLSTFGIVVPGKLDQRIERQTRKLADIRNVGNRR
jgi:hypothetical protein